MGKGRAEADDRALGAEASAGTGCLPGGAGQERFTPPELIKQAKAAEVAGSTAIDKPLRKTSLSSPAC
jgi:hypothetical protein